MQWTFARETFNEVPIGPFQSVVVPTGKEVDGRVAVFRPGVDGEVRLRDDQETRHAEGGEMLEKSIHHFHPRFFGGSPENSLDPVRVHQTIHGTIPQFDEPMLPEDLEFSAF